MLEDFLRDIPTLSTAEIRTYIETLSDTDFFVLFKIFNERMSNFGSKTQSLFATLANEIESADLNNARCDIPISIHLNYIFRVQELTFQDMPSFISSPNDILKIDKKTISRVHREELCIYYINILKKIDTLDVAMAAKPQNVTLLQDVGLYDPLANINDLFARIPDESLYIFMLPLMRKMHRIIFTKDELLKFFALFSPSNGLSLAIKLIGSHKESDLINYFNLGKKELLDHFGHDINYSARLNIAKAEQEEYHYSTRDFKRPYSPTMFQNYNPSYRDVSPLHIEGLSYQSVLGDGNCFFYVVGHYRDMDALSLRQVTVEYIRENKNDLIHFFPGTEAEFDMHLDRFEAYDPASQSMYKQNNSLDMWADHLHIHALSMALSTTIIILGQNADEAIQKKIINEEFMNEGTQPIITHYVGNSHYNALLINNNRPLSEILHELGIEIRERHVLI